MNILSSHIDKFNKLSDAEIMFNRKLCVGNAVLMVYSLDNLMLNI